MTDPIENMAASARMTYHEKVLLDKMAEIRRGFERAKTDEQRDKCLCAIMLLVDCICEFRDRCGAMVDEGAK